MSARYLVRFDDLCPTAAWEQWDRAEAVLRRHDVRPLVAVVPDNRDPSLVAATSADDFWDRVRQWQSWGWSIGLHGYQHVYETNDAGLVGLRAKSEFAGLPYDVQAAKLDAALHVFTEQRVTPDAWIAPGHTFDSTTLEALVERGVDVVSDGFHAQPGKDRRGVIWVPQQLWRLRRRHGGTWTACYHVNRWTESDHVRFEADLAAYRPSITDLPTAVMAGRARRMGAADTLSALRNRSAVRLRARAARLVLR